jgi:phospholipid transport system transporter-binding protein
LPEATPAIVELIDRRTGHVDVRGPLSFATAKRARAAGRQLIETSSAAALEFDCSGVTESDSAGLAVLLDWLALAKCYGRGIRFNALPAPIRAVAALSNVDTFLNQGLKPKVNALSE